MVDWDPDKAVGEQVTTTELEELEMAFRTEWANLENIRRRLLFQNAPEALVLAVADIANGADRLRQACHDIHHCFPPGPDPDADEEAPPWSMPGQ